MMMFIQKQILRIVSIAQNRFASRGFTPWTPGALPLYPAGGLGSPQAPHLLGGLWLLLPPIHFNSPATSNHFDNPDYYLHCIIY